MKTLPLRLIAAAVLALLATALVINAGPWRSFARFADGYVKPHKDPGQKIAVTPQPLQSTFDESSLKSGAYFTIYRNDQGEAVCRASTLAEVRQLDVNRRELRLRPINHPELFSTQSQQEPLAAGSGLTIILRATQQLQQNPTAVAAFTRAAQNWEALVMSPVTIYIDVDFGPTFFGQTFPSGVLGATSAPSESYPYDSARANLVAEANGEGNVTKQAVFDALPSTTVPTDLGTSGSTVVSDPTARAIGLLPPSAASTDRAAKIGFNSNVTFDFDPSDGINSGQLDFDAVATHEIAHALGFNSEAGLNLPRPAVLDLYRFRTGTSTGTFTNAQRLVTIGGSPDPLQFLFVPGNNELGLSTGGASGSFANGGDGWQSSHWKHATVCAPYIGIMDPAIGSGCRRTITSNDTLALSYFGYNLTNNNPPPPPPNPPPPPANDNFANGQIINGCSGNVTGTSFGATSEVGEPSHAPNDPSSLSPSHTVWYQWQPSSTGTATITTAGSEFDTILAVYTGTSVGSLTRIVFNDDVQSGTLTSSVTFTATGGASYRIAVDGWSGDVGGLKLNWIGCGATPTPTPSPTPPSDCPSSLTVNDGGDAADAVPGDGLCATAGGVCTLRAAIQEANSRSLCGTVDINFNSVASPINLSTALPDINHNVNLNSPGVNQLTVQRSTLPGTPNFRVMRIASGRTVSISGLTISNGKLNFTEGFGGGINNQGTLTLSECVVSNNSSEEGGGIFNQGSLTINSSTISNNTATVGAGGGIAGGGTALYLINSTVANNAAHGSGGGVLIANPINTVSFIINSTISGNSAEGDGGGIFVSNDFRVTLTIVNSTITANRANANGGAIARTNGILSLRNTIVTGNFIGTGATGNDINFQIDSSSAFNLIGVCTGCGLLDGPNGNQIGAYNPALGALANNGGPTKTHALLAGSAAINKGSNTLAVDQNNNPLVTDQRGVGFNRIINSMVDVGAYEAPQGVPTPTPTPTPSPAPLPTPVQLGNGIIQLPLAAKDLVYDSGTAKVYASIPSTAGSFGNSLAPVNPINGMVSTPIFLGHEPVKLAISGDNQYIYVGFSGDGAVRRFDLATQTIGLQFSLGVGSLGDMYVDDMAVLPDNPNAVAVSRRNYCCSPRHEKVAIYDNGVQRPTITGFGSLNEAIEFSSPTTLYGYDNEASDFLVSKMAVNASGVAVISAKSNLISGFGVDIKYDNGRLYASSGRVVDPEAATIVGNFPVNSLAFVPDSSVQRVYFVTGSGNSTTLQAFDQNTLALVGSLSIPGVNGTPGSLIRWGANGLAFRTSGNQVYFIQTSLIPTITPVLLTDTNNHVIAIESVTFVRDPFPIAGLHNFSSDQRTRITIFTSNLGLTQPTAELSVTAGAIPLTVEGVGALAGAPDVSYIIVKLDPMLSGNVPISITSRGVTSNVGVLSISP